MNFMNLALICDDGYIIPTMVTLFSIIQTKSNSSNIRANIIVNTKYREKYNIIKKLERDDFIINIIFENSEQINYLDTRSEETYCAASTSALLKFFIPNILGDCDKVLYLDGDILVRKDLTELYTVDVCNAYGAMVIDSGKLYSGRKIVKETENYFNSGVMLLNIGKMKTVIGELVASKIGQRDQTLMDQDVFNEVIGSNIIMLPIKYNFLYTNLARRCDTLAIEDLNNLYHTNYETLRDVYLDSYILHFSSKDKPWKCTGTPMSRKWYECYQSMKKKLDIDQETAALDIFERTLSKDTKLKNAIIGKVFEVKREIIISLTSYPARIEKVFKTLDSLFAQIEIADKIILCLAKNEWDNKKELPSGIEKYVKKGLEILWEDKDLKPHKKYFYTMQKYPESIIITVDDDLIYNNSMSATLIQSYMQYPDCVSANRVHVISFDEKKNLKPYMQWKQQFQHCICRPNMALLPTGCGGVLYPPHCLSAEVFDVQLIEALCPTTDDLWLKIMCAKNGTNTVCASPFFKLDVVEGTQSTGLYKTNRMGGENDKQLYNIWNYLNKNEDLLWKEKIYQDNLFLNTFYMNPIFSIILPVCDKKCDLLSSVRSLLNQNIEDIEIIILDNGSKAKRLLEFMGHSKIKIIIDNFITRAQAANIGLQIARGEYILVTDPNIMYHKDFLEKVYLKACYGDADIICNKIDFWDPILGKQKVSDWEKRFHCFPVSETFLFDEIKQDRFAAFSYRVCDKVIRRDFLISQKVKFGEQGSCYGDMNFIYTLLLNAKKIAVINESLGEQDIRSIMRHARCNKWEWIRSSLLEFKEELEKDNVVWSKYERDYINFELFVCINEFKYENSEFMEKHYYQLKTDFEDLSIVQKEGNFFYNQRFYQMSQFIQTFDFIWTGNKNQSPVDSMRIADLEKDNLLMREKSKEMQKKQIELEYYQYSLNETRKSVSYRCGRILTFIPRLLRHVLFKYEM